MSFKVGDTVKLKSARSRMTIVEIAANGWCVVVWHDRSGKEQKSSYPPEALESYSSGMRTLRVVRG